MKNSFFLVIPEQKHDPELLQSFDEETLTSWVAELPTANPGLSTRLFHDLIIEMNGLKMPAQKRLEGLERLRPSFLVIEDYLRSRLIKSGFPKSTNDCKIMDVLVSIEKEFTIGYWMIVKELTRREIGWFQGKNTALTIQRTIKGLSSIVVTHYMMNRPVPDWIWIDLHSLYKLSIKVKKDSSKITDESCTFGKTTTSEECYKQVLLFSLTDPSGLMQKEFRQIYNFIEKINALVRIENHPIDEQKLQCVILMDEDSAPYFNTSGKQADSSMMYLDLTRIIKAFQQADKYCSENEPRYSSIDLHQTKFGKLPAELFNYLLQRWQGIPLQGAALFSDRLDRYIAIGLEATYNLQSSNAEVDLNELEILTETNSDMALSCQFDNPGVLSIGSLVSCRRKDAPPSVRLLGVISKITIPKQDNKLIFELNVVANQSFAVNYLNIDAPADSEPQKALLYALKDNNEEKSYIIFDSFLFKDGDVLRMFMNQENFPVILRDRKNIGLGYWQFECRRLAEKAVSPASQKKKGYDFI
ncbi:hypothetical protein [Methylomarinum vadi]|uniref:hypothetical protein n=1 Tax=Methylomarinum vadi TaxID=438855 RepID=UPI0004DF1363|nr:hypothetical protein [Methylomarinum vadi]